jgi:urease accessory protein
MIENNLLSLLQLTDPTLPIGSFSHSAGLETYVQQGLVRDVATAKEFIKGMLEQNLQYTDAAFVSLAYEACIDSNIKRILELDDECTAVKLPKEMREASKKLGTRLIKIFQSVCKNSIADKYKEAIITPQATGHYCIAFGIYAHALNINKSDALTGFYYNAAVGMVTNSVKLIPLGQQDGQKLLFSLQPLINQLVQNSITPNSDLIGLCCTGFDIRSMQHEQLYSRLYMS